MPAYPTLRKRVELCLSLAGYSPYSGRLPTKRSGGVFLLGSGEGVSVTVEWWDVPAEERRELLESFAAALEAAGLVVADQGDRLYVAEPEERGDEE